VSDLDPRFVKLLNSHRRCEIARAMDDARSESTGRPLIFGKIG